MCLKAVSPGANEVLYLYTKSYAKIYFSHCRPISGLIGISDLDRQAAQIIR